MSISTTSTISTNMMMRHRCRLPTASIRTPIDTIRSLTSMPTIRMHIIGITTSPMPGERHQAMSILQATQ